MNRKKLVREIAEAVVNRLVQKGCPVSVEERVSVSNENDKPSFCAVCSNNPCDCHDDDTSDAMAHATRVVELERRSMEHHDEHHRRVNKIVHDQDEIITGQRHALQELAADKAALMRRVNELKRNLKGRIVSGDALVALLEKIYDLSGTVHD